MIRTIVVPLDGGPHAELALDTARTVAVPLGATIELVGATDHLTPESGVVRSAGDYFDRLASSVPGVEISAVLEPGNAAEVILARVHDRPDAMVCMTTRGHTGLGALLLGSVAERVIDGVTGPILLVGPHCRSMPAAFTDGQLVFAYDSSPLAESAVDLAVEWATRFDLDLHIAMVLHRDNTFLGDHDATIPRQRARALADRLTAEGVRARLELVDGIEPARAIARFATDLPATLVVAASHGETGLTATTLGRVATRLAHHAPCPVLIQRVPRDGTPP